MYISYIIDVTAGSTMKEIKLGYIFKTIFLNVLIPDSKIKNIFIHVLNGMLFIHTPY